MTKFIEITNKDIFNKLEKIELQVIKINGKVKLNRWIATTALGLALFSVGYFARHLIQ